MIIPRRRRRREKRDPELILNFVREQVVVYERQVQVALEDYMEHRTTRELLGRLVREGELASSVEEHYVGGGKRKIRWFYLPNADEEELETAKRTKLILMGFYTGYERAFVYEGMRYDDYAEYLVERAFLKAGYRVVGKSTNYFNGKRYTKKDVDLDFIVYSPSGHFIGVEVKNRLDYPELKDIVNFLDITSFLGLKPLFIARFMPKKYIMDIIEAGGYVVITKRYFLRPGVPRPIFDALIRIGIPLGVYNRPPKFLVRRLEQAIEYFEQKDP